MRSWLLRLALLFTIVAFVFTMRRRRSGAKLASEAVWPPLEDAAADGRWAPAAMSTIPDDVPPSQRWSEPAGKQCPAGFEVKVKLASGIYHLPGMFAYQRTIPDRCYARRRRPRPTASAPPSASRPRSPPASPVAPGVRVFEPSLCAHTAWARFRAQAADGVASAEREVTRR